MSSANHNSHSSGGSVRVILIAFAANLGIALSKFFGAFVSGSASLLAEAIHSLVDCSNQVLLLVGSKKSQKTPDDLHPLGYGREAFFWSFMVAILLFSMGGLFAIYEGVHKLNSTEEMNSPMVAFGILIFSLVLEAYSFFACYKEVKVQKKNQSLWQWFKTTKSSELLVIFTEDAAALVGLTIATICLVISWVTGQIIWDALGSIFIGILLVIVALFLAIEVKSFLIGESSSDDIRQYIEEQVKVIFPAGSVLKFISLQLGSDEVMLSYKVHPGSLSDLNVAIEKVNELERKTKVQFTSVRWQFVELDRED